MEKNRIRPIAGTKVMRMSYSRQKEVLEMPNLIEVQKDSYQWFLDEGLKEVFDDISPIADYSGALSLEFVDFELCKDDVKYSIEESIAAEPVQEITVQEPEPVSAPDNGCVPDPAISVETMNAYGYTDRKYENERNKNPCKYE